MEALGYTLSPHVLDAADYGVSQNRPRLMIVATWSKAPFVLRKRTGAQRPIEPHIQWDRGPSRVIMTFWATAALGRFETCVCTPISGGPLPSSLQHQKDLEGRSSCSRRTHAILFLEILDHVQLMAIHPPANIRRTN
jgi:site-specific DNA-cytosine methylase